MSVSLPEYTNHIHTDGAEFVMSSPAWHREYGPDVTVLVDARTWPPELANHAMRTSTATRHADGRWLCVAKREGTWSLFTFANISATTPARVDELPIEAAKDVAEKDDDGPIIQLHAFAGKLFAIPEDGPARVRDLDGTTWSEHPTLKRDAENRQHAVNVILPDNTPAMKWGDVLYDAAMQPIDALDCYYFTRAGDHVLAQHASVLVEFRGTELASHLPDHTIAGIETGPRNTAWITLSRDDERGTHYDRALYDPAARTVTMLPTDLVGEFPKLLACTPAGDIVLHNDREHTLFTVSAAQLAELPRIPAAELPVPPKLQLPVLDDLGASSRPIVATTGDAIAIALGRSLRLHTIDAPKAVVELAEPIVAIAALAGRFAVLDRLGGLHTYTIDGKLLGTKPTSTAPRSLTTAGDAWVVLGKDRIRLVEDTRTRTIEIPNAIAAASDPDTNDLVIACEDRRLAVWTDGELRDVPPTIEQIVTIAPLGNRKFACLGVRELYLLDLAMPELVSLDRRIRVPSIAGNGDGRLAQCSAPGSLNVEALEDVKLVPLDKGSVHYSSYSRPDDSEVTVHGLAFMDDGRLVIALDEGRANIIAPDTGAALKLDEQPGDANSSWVFITGAGILIAG